MAALQSRAATLSLSINFLNIEIMKTTFMERMEQSAKAIKYWWVLLIAGILFAIAGLVAVLYPGITYVTLSLILGVAIFCAGLSRIIIAASSSGYMPGWGWMLTGGILELLLGILLWVYPGLTAVMLYLFVGFYLMFSGCSMIASSIDLQKFEGSQWGWVLASGIISILLSFLVVANPIEGSLAVSYLIGFAFVFGGFSFISFAFKLRNVHKHFQNLKDKV